MKKDILAKAVRLADKSKARPDKVVISKPASSKSAPKPVAEIMSERLYTRITPREMKRLKARVGSAIPTSELLRELLIQYLDNKDKEHGRKKA